MLHAIKNIQNLIKLLELLMGRLKTQEWKTRER